MSGAAHAVVAKCNCAKPQADRRTPARTERPTPPVTASGPGHNFERVAVDRPGHGDTICLATGAMHIRTAEHCAGDCVRRHELGHAANRGECCRRHNRCTAAATDAEARRRCTRAYEQWFPTLTNFTECNAYTIEVQCLTSLIESRCTPGGAAAGGGRGALIGGLVGGAVGAIGGGLIGGLLGGTGFGFLGAALGGVAGAAIGAGLGYGIGSSAEQVSPECCNTLRTELENARQSRDHHCGIANDSPCPFAADGTLAAEGGR